MRIRTVKPAFFTDDRLAALPPLTRILFQGLWCIADRAGRLEDRPLRIKALVLPYDEHDIDAALAALEGAGFLIRYEVEGRKLIEIPGLPRHQHFNVKEQDSSLPAPISTKSAQSRHRARTAPTRQEGKGTGKEQEGKGTDTATLDFDRFWEGYPLKKNKEAARKAWAKLTPDATLVEAIIAAVIAQGASTDWMRDGGQYIPHASTWLNNRRWEDEVRPGGTVVHHTKAAERSAASRAAVEAFSRGTTQAAPRDVTPLRVVEGGGT